MNLDSFRFLLKPWAIALNLLLVTQLAGNTLLSRKEATPLVAPLTEIPRQFGEWRSPGDIEMDAESLKILHPDSYVIRVYNGPKAGLNASLFVAYFQSQRTGHAPHTPQNCLPGHGWIPETRAEIELPVSDRNPVKVNRYIVSRGDEKSIVLYWYQTPTRVVANEYGARLQLVMDSIRYNRSDTALVRVVAPILDDEAAADRAAVQFAAQVHQAVRRQIPMI
jgi:EpsI family protein